jgi:hypothetical protein
MISNGLSSASSRKIAARDIAVRQANAASAANS